MENYTINPGRSVRILAKKTRQLASSAANIDGQLKRYRRILWSAGTLFAAGLAHFGIGDEIYPFVQ